MKNRHTYDYFCNLLDYSYEDSKPDAPAVTIHESEGSIIPLIHVPHFIAEHFEVDGPMQSLLQKVDLDIEHATVNQVYELVRTIGAEITADTHLFAEDLSLEGLIFQAVRFRTCKEFTALCLRGVEPVICTVIESFPASFRCGYRIMSATGIDGVAIGPDAQYLIDERWACHKHDPTDNFMDDVEEVLDVWDGCYMKVRLHSGIEAKVLADFERN